MHSGLVLLSAQPVEEFHMHASRVRRFGFALVLGLATPAPIPALAETGLVKGADIAQIGSYAERAPVDDGTAFHLVSRALDELLASGGRLRSVPAGLSDYLVAALRRPQVRSSAIALIVRLPADPYVQLQAVDAYILARFFDPATVSWDEVERDSAPISLLMSWLRDPFYLQGLLPSLRRQFAAESALTAFEASVAVEPAGFFSRRWHRTNDLVRRQAAVATTALVNASLFLRLRGQGPKFAEMISSGRWDSASDIRAFMRALEVAGQTDFRISGLVTRYKEILMMTPEEFEASGGRREDRPLFDGLRSRAYVAFLKNAPDAALDSLDLAHLESLTAFWRASASRKSACGNFFSRTARLAR